MEKLNNRQVHDLHSSPDFIAVINQRWAGHLAYSMLGCGGGNLRDRDDLKEIGVEHERTILKEILTNRRGATGRH
jgi:hypothetical protein